MTKIFAAAALAALIATPASAQSIKSEGSGAGLKSYAASEFAESQEEKGCHHLHAAATCFALFEQSRI